MIKMMILLPVSKMSAVAVMISNVVKDDKADDSHNDADMTATLLHRYTPTRTLSSTVD